MKTKEVVNTLSGLGISTVSYFLGGWDRLLQFMIIVVASDFILGILNAMVFKHSKKTESGGLSSIVCYRGLVKKIVIFILIALMQQVDITLGANGFFRDAVIYGFITNELLSILETVGQMGLVNLPPIITNAIELLKDKSNQKLDK